MTMRGLHIPTPQDVLSDKERRNIIRIKARGACLNSSDTSHQLAADMAIKGYGIEDIKTVTGCSQDMARRLVLGTQ